MVNFRNMRLQNMSYNKNKCDPELGKAVQAHLEKLGLHTPMSTNTLNAKQKIAKIEKHMQGIMQTLGLDLTDDSLIETPIRVAKMYVNEVFWGLDPEAFPKCTAVDNKISYDEMVVEEDITVMSNCEHHFVTIDGFATVAYLPNKKVLGLSKMNRIVEYFSKRPQIQERLTVQIAEALKFILDTEHVAVLINASHYCVKSRGVEDTNSHTITSHLSGKFREDALVRGEFMALATRRK
jgi:GTP cyclohydrolase IA